MPVRPRGSGGHYELLANRLKKTPLSMPDPFGGPPVAFTYPDMVATTLSALYSPDGYTYLDPCSLT